MESLLATATSALVAVTALITTLTLLVPKVRELRKTLRRNMTLIGVVGKCPEPLKHVPEYTDIKKAVDSGHKQAVLYCRTLSFALRHCDYVSYITGSDEKIHTPEDPFWEHLEC